MAVDTKQKRMSAIHPSVAWRGALVDPVEAGFTVGNRQAAAFLYSGIASTVAVGVNAICSVNTANNLTAVSFPGRVAGPP